MPLSGDRKREYEREWARKKRKSKPEYYLWKAAKRRAKLKNLEFNIEVTDIIIPQFCPLLNIPIVNNTGNRCRVDGSPSLDRIDNTLGYTKGNIMVVSWRANFLKSDASLKELLLLTTNLQSLLIRI